MKKIAALLITCCFITNIIVAQNTPCALSSDSDEKEVRKVVENFVKGIDLQDGDQILKTFYEGSSLNAFAPDGKKIITLPAKQFAQMHQDKKFGGQNRELKISELSVTDGLQASASVDAFNEKVFYNYRLTLIKQDGKWLILSMMQRSRLQTKEAKEGS